MATPPEPRKERPNPRLGEAEFTARQLSLILLLVAIGCAVAVPAVWASSQGPLAREMAIHIALMSCAAPISAAVVYVIVPTPPLRPAWLWVTTILQLVLLWSLHVPNVHHATMASGPVRALSLAALFLGAMGFWLCLLWRGSSSAPWQEILALLLTAKLACLLAALLVFAPREIFADAHHSRGGMVDQQAAGLLMLIACPLTYFVPAIFLAARLLSSAGSLARAPTLLARPT